ncbi:MAG: sigma-70 family RNA polymerase sigma factor [Clostridia bacterium]|nr:sigma-70 family RNA polymerase sigma factor [Clostridia bacterium]
MQNYLLKPLIEKIKEQDMSVFFQVFEEFKHLIVFLGNKLGYEDAQSELTLFFIELLYSIKLSKFPTDDGDELHRYIAVSIKNKYISLSMAKVKSNKFENHLFEECYGITDSFDKNICMSQAIKKLNDAQRLIFFYHYIYGFSINEIAERLNISRQAVNKTKNRILGILREAIINEECL